MYKLYVCRKNLTLEGPITTESKGAVAGAKRKKKKRLLPAGRTSPPRHFRSKEAKLYSILPPSDAGYVHAGEH